MGEDNGVTRFRFRFGPRALVVAAVIGPLSVLVALRAWPSIDVRWDSQPAHFWLVLGAAAVATTIAVLVSEAGRRRYDARLVLVSLTFLASAAFLGLHALATPGVLLDGSNVGFELATPIGLVIGSFFAAASARDLPSDVARAIVDRSRWLLVGLAGVVVGWAGMSLLELTPLDRPVAGDQLPWWQGTAVVFGVVGYGFGGWRYLRLFRERRARIVLHFAIAFVLLAVALVVVAFAMNWHVSWWEWHGLLVAAFVLIAHGARREWHEERFSALYLQQTLAGTTEASVLFADLASFTPFSERHDAAEVRAMLDTYWSELIPTVRRQGGEVQQLIGDAIMVVFNRHGHQRDHAVLAAQAALAFQVCATAVAARHPEWPRFRVGVNSGVVSVGVVGGHGHREHNVIGDTVNLAARLESMAPVGGVLIGSGTREELPDGTVVEELAPVAVKGKAEPVTAYVLHHMPDR